MAHRRDELVLEALDAITPADVDDRAENQEPPVRMNRVVPHFDGKLSAVLAPPGKLAVPDHATLRMTRELHSLLSILGAQN